ncbi:hypothetical protein AAG747_29040 [Rapidithrix thailandica]|uniref:Uncharacterized protein n=1 Tax=Rapidithrix thailandica TaxID=413964 RepID=A0AAW9SMC5_9BACT
MSTYFNFCYIDLEKEANPFDDDGEFYLIENRPSYEYLSNPTLFTTTNNYFVDECFSKVVEKGNDKLLPLEKLKFVFGNMFWKENFKPNNEGISFFMNYWKLNWTEHPAIKERFFLDFYSIHLNEIIKILEVVSEVGLDDYFDYVARILTLDKEREQKHRTTIIEWIKMYELAADKEKGIVYDIG